jgi:hypothetical protein
MIILAVLIGVLLLLVAGCVGWQLLHNTSGTGNQPQHSPAPGTSTQASAQPSATGKLISTFCNDAKGHTFDKVQSVLKKDGFKVKREDVPGERDRVVEVTPCEAPLGSTVTVRVGNGKSAGASGPGPGDASSSAPANGGGGGPGGGGGLSCSLGVGGGLGCPSPPNPSKNG